MSPMLINKSMKLSIQLTRLLAVGTVTIIMATYLYFGLGMRCILADSGWSVPIERCGFPLPAAVDYSLSPYPLGSIVVGQATPSVRFVASGAGLNFLIIWLPLFLLVFWFYSFATRTRSGRGQKNQGGGSGIINRTE